MQFSTLLATILAGASVTMAVPAKRQTTLCPGLSGTPQCCAVNVLNVADLNCANRKSSHFPNLDSSSFCSSDTVGWYILPIAPKTPTTMDQFIKECAAIGQQAQCCTIPIVSLSSRHFLRTRTIWSRDRILTIHSARSRPHLLRSYLNGRITDMNVVLWTEVGFGCNVLSFPKCTLLLVQPHCLSFPRTVQRTTVKVTFRE